MRYLPIVAAALLLLLIYVSCSGDSTTLKADSAVSGFTLSDAEIDAFEASPAPNWKNIAPAQPGDIISSPPVIFADAASVQTKGASWWGKSKCDNCKGGCSSCSHKWSCKCKGKCKQSCSKCKSSCGKCDHKTSCGCKGKCKEKCGKCKDKCGKCGHDGNCGCKGKCKEECGKCKDKCGKCGHDGNCGCKGKCKIKCGHCNSKCKKCGHDGNCGCKKCEPSPCDVKCTGMTSSSQKRYDADCATGCATATYNVKLTFNDCPDVANEALGREVVFFRNGVEVGRATTDAGGNATFSDACLEPGTYKIMADYDGGCFVCFDVVVKDIDCCECVCEGMTNKTERFFKVKKCLDHYLDLTYKVHLNQSTCPPGPNGAVVSPGCGPAGHEVVFYRDGVEKGRALTDANGDATFVDKWVALGSYHITAESEGCSTEFDVLAYDDCRVHACIAGKGKLPSVNGSKYMNFAYEIHVDGGTIVAANKMSFSDGDISFTDIPATWIIVNGLEVFFGNNDVMFRTIDHGMAPGADFIEVFIFSKNYHNSGNLLNGQIRTSWGIKTSDAPVYVP